MLMLDGVTELIAGQHARGFKLLADGEPWVQGHFPGNPVMPGVLILESLAQLGAVLALATEPLDPARCDFVFLGVDKAKFTRPIRPGERLDLDVTVLQQRGGTWKLLGEATVAGQRCAQAELLTAILPRQPSPPRRES